MSAFSGEEEAFIFASKSSRPLHHPTLNTKITADNTAEYIPLQGERKLQDTKAENTVHRRPNKTVLTNKIKKKEEKRTEQQATMDFF